MKKHMKKTQETILCCSPQLSQSSPRVDGVSERFKKFLDRHRLSVHCLGTSGDNTAVRPLPQDREYIVIFGKVQWDLVSVYPPAAQRNTEDVCASLLTLRYRDGLHRNGEEQICRAQN